MTLPFLPDAGFRQSFNGVVDELGDGTSMYHIVGVTDEGQAIANLWYLGTNGVLTEVTATAPVTLTTSSRIYLTGAYVSQEVV